MTSTTVPTTVNLRPGHLVAILVAAVTLTAALTWVLTDLALDAPSDLSSNTTPAVVVGTPQDLQAAYTGVYTGRAVPTSDEYALAKATLAAGATPAAVAPTTQAFTVEQLRVAWAALTAGSTGIPDDTTPAGAQAGIGGAGAFIPHPPLAAYTALTAGSTGIPDRP